MDRDTRERLKKQQAHSRERKQKAADKANNGKSGKKKRRGRPKFVGGRLPDGSTFLVTWHEGKQLWGGTLSVPDSSGAARLHKSSAKALFTLCEKLDRLYRSSVGDRSVPPVQDSNS